LLIWNKELWLIDHGASLYFHHNWDDWRSHLERTFPNVKDHVLLQKATELELASAEIKRLVNFEIIQDIVSIIPEEWLMDKSSELTPTERRDAYTEFLQSRLSKIDLLAKNASDAR
jgi:hypothetical protein